MVVDSSALSVTALTGVLETVFSSSGLAVLTTLRLSLLTWADSDAVWGRNKRCSLRESFEGIGSRVGVFVCLQARTKKGFRVAYLFLWLRGDLAGEDRSSDGSGGDIEGLLLLSPQADGGKRGGSDLSASEDWHVRLLADLCAGEKGL